jgi:hypothetical protein
LRNCVTLQQGHALPPSRQSSLSVRPRQCRAALLLVLQSDDAVIIGASE